MPFFLARKQAMAHLPRFVIPDQPQHVILRGNNRAETFCADADYSLYLEKLKLACDKYGCSVHAYVQMTNHVHLLITPTSNKAMQMLGRYYLQYYNYCYREFFKHQLSENCITEIRESTNKAWMLGNDRFKQRIQEQLGRRVELKVRGGDKSLMPSESFLQMEIFHSE